MIEKDFKEMYRLIEMKDEDMEERMNFNKILKNVKEEHKQMEQCPKCKGKNIAYRQQHLIEEDNKYCDLLIYYCSDCDETYERKLEVKHLNKMED